jgi:hypothetical protein
MGSPSHPNSLTPAVCMHDSLSFMRRSLTCTHALFTFMHALLSPSHLFSQEVPAHVVKAFGKAQEAVSLRKPYEQAVAADKPAGERGGRAARRRGGRHEVMTNQRRP